MRFFIALEIPDENRFQFKQIQSKLKELFPQIQLTDPTKLHLTLAFIGEQDESLINPLTRVITEAARDIPSFKVTPCCLDGFPHLHTAKILWAGVKGDVDRLLTIRHRIKDGLIDLHLDVDERRFIPHIALAKTKNFYLSAQEEDQLEKIMQEQIEPIEVTSIKLFQSIPNHGLHSHNTLAEIKLL